MIIRTALALALAFFAATATSADHHMTGMQSGAAVTVTEAWARASIGKNGAAFLTVTNRGKTGDTLVGVDFATSWFHFGSSENNFLWEC